MTATIRLVQRHHVAHHAHRAITERLRHAAPDAVLSVDRTPDHPAAVVLQVNSGGNAIACRTALTRAGYRCEDIPSPADQYGVRLRILPTASATPNT